MIDLLGGAHRRQGQSVGQMRVNKVTPAQSIFTNENKRKEYAMSVLPWLMAHFIHRPKLVSSSGFYSAYRLRR